MPPLRPGRHPRPPPDLGAHLLPLTELRGPWLRIHASVFTPIHFGKAQRNRFDAPGGAFGVMYVAESTEGAFAETIAPGHRLARLDPAELTERRLALVHSRRPLLFADISGPGLLRLGADARLGAGSYRMAQRWSASIHAHPARVDGIRYRSRNDPECVSAALFQRCAGELYADDVGCFLDPDLRPLLASLLQRYALALDG
jgi:hypothetical protein